MCPYPTKLPTTPPEIRALSAFLSPTCAQKDREIQSAGSKAQMGAAPGSLALGCSSQANDTFSG